MSEATPPLSSQRSGVKLPVAKMGAEAALKIAAQQMSRLVNFRMRPA
jgi:hypothetical protein